MARKKREQPQTPNHRFQTALEQHADILDAAPREHRPWLEEVIRLTFVEGSYYDEQLREMANDLLGLVRLNGLARGVVEFLTVERNQYLWSRSGMQPSKRTLFALLRQVLADPDPDWRTGAASLVAGLAPEKEDAISLLTACLQDEAPGVRWCAALSLSHLSPQTPGVVEELARVVRAEPPLSPSLGTPETAHALARLSVPSGIPMRRSLFDEEGLLHAEQAAGAPEAALALAGMGTHARAALPALRERLARGPGRTGADLASWRAARQAVEAITGSTEESTAILAGWVRRALTLEVPGEVGRALLLDLARVDPTGVEVGPLFTDALRNPDLAVTAAWALYGAGPAALPALASALAHEQPAVRVMAARTLARMGSKAGAAVPALVGALNDPDKDVRQAVRDALASIHSYLFVTRHLGRSQEEAFLESILETLGDEAPCLIYADWLEEYGNAAAQACAQIVRERLLRGRDGD
jgi:uncharacterized protein (TIGR02996 family)